MLILHRNNMVKYILWKICIQLFWILLQMATAPVRGEQYSAVNILNSNTGSHDKESSVTMS